MGQTQHTVGTANVRASCIAAAGDRQRRRLRQRRQHLPRPLQRAGRDRPRPRYRDAAALLRPRRGRLEALVPRLGDRLRLDALALRLEADHGDVRHPVDPLVRRGDAAEGPGQAEGQPQGHDRVRPRRQHRHPHAGGGEGAREARAAGGRPIRIRPPGRCSASARTTPICCRSAPSSSAPARAPPRTARSSGASRSSSRSSNRRTTTR